MNTTRIAVITAAAAVAAWAAKAVAIGVAGGLDKSPLEGPLFLVGLACFLVAVCSLALSALGRHGGWLLRVGAVVASVVGGVLVTALVGAVIDAVAVSDHWAWFELNLWIISTTLLALAAWRSSRQRPALVRS